jgi:uncharacterized protein (TIGR03435 family)
MKIAFVGLFACCVAYGQAIANSLSFEAAAINPAQSSDDDTLCYGGLGTSSPGQYRCSNATLADIVRFAFSVRPFALSYVGPQTAAFDITAKVPTGTTKEDCRVMLQKLLIERFKLVYHHEKRDVQGYELVVGRNGSKLKESPPETPHAADSAATPSSSPRGKLTPDRDGFPVLPPARGQMLLSSLPSGAKRMIYSDVTLEPVISFLMFLLDSPVTDLTGLKGRYDVTVTFMDPKYRADSSASTEGGPLPAANAVDEAPDIFTAFERQLGLKLERKKVAVDVVVIDHAEKTPTEN